MRTINPGARLPRGRTLCAGLLACTISAGLLTFLTGTPAPVPNVWAGELQSDQEALTGFNRLGRRLRVLAQAGVERWHARGHRGRGVKIAILDSGFRGYREQLGKSLPSKVTVKSFRADGNLEARDSQPGKIGRAHV